MFRSYLIFTSLILILFSCKQSTPPESGVPLTLAQERKAFISDLKYQLALNIPNNPEEAIKGNETVHFNSKKELKDVVLDFRQRENSVKSVRANGEQIKVRHENEHIIIPAKYIREGENNIEIEFEAGSSALNRNKEYMYALFVPDRARTAFPCFDQPDMKAVYELTLTIPANWEAMSNADIRSAETTGDTKIVHFEPSDLISTYLFSFTAGVYKVDRRVVDGREMEFFYRETDSVKLKASVPAIFEMHAQSLKFMEDYTAIPHPFKKFSFAAIPDFQFGGMEHPGAIWYNANILFLDSSATRTQLIRRANLIAHETSHMWFGDLVTMRWFDDVWMKEVFANFMADKIVGIILPDDNIDIKFVVDHFPLSYSIDRTKGANPIRQELENLQEAGTLYGHIIYHKAPIMMLQLERLIGEQALQSGLQEYLKTYSFDNASWPDLITILDTNTPEDLQSWNDNWVNKAGRPTYTRMITDPKGDNYGLFDVDTTKIAELYKITDPVLRAFQYINLYENMLEGRFIDPNTFVTVTLTALDYEKEELLIQQLLSQLGVAYWNFISADQRAARAGELESKLWTLMEQANKNNLKKMFFKSYTGIAQSDAATTKIYSLWKNKTAPSGVNLTDDEYADLATWLAIRNHPQSREILNEQLTRIDNTDKKQRWEFWMPALSPDEKERDAFFESLKNANNRRKESWVNTALSYLHHPLRRESAEKYIRPSLELLPEIQKTGDIFFPQNWLQAILTYHNSENAAQTVQQFIDENPDFNKRLLNKLLQGADMLFRANRKSTN